MKTSLSALHHQASDWLRELDFYANEIAILQHRLKEYASGTMTPEEAKQCDDFNKQFNNLELAISGLKHDVNVREAVIENLTKETGEKSDEINTPEDVILKQVTDLLREISDTRLFFNMFLARVKKH
jgi:predicted  nucleic acid-binding Zn-ribbon protein